MMIKITTVRKMPVIRNVLSLSFTDYLLSHTGRIRLFQWAAFSSMSFAHVSDIRPRIWSFCDV